MAFTANTVKPIRFLRSFAGNMEPPTYDFPVVHTLTSTAIYKGNVVILDTSGKVTIATGAAGGAPDTGVVPSTADAGLVGFALSGSAGAPSFPTSGGASALGLIMTTPASMTTDDPIPESEKLSVCLAMPYCVFYGHLGDSNAAAEIDYSTSTQTVLMLREGLSVSATAGDNRVGFIDITATNNIIRPLRFAYPQLPTARTTTGQGDPWRMTSTTYTNPAVEFQVVDSMWNPLS